MLDIPTRFASPLEIHLVFPRLPPAHDAIGEHTIHLATALKKYAGVRVLTGIGQLPGDNEVRIDQVYAVDSPRGIRQLINGPGQHMPDWLVIQYNPFSYGRWGWNPHLAPTVEAIKQKYPSIKLALLVHEISPPLLNWRLALMNIWQRAQLRALGRNVDFVFFCIASWERSFGSYFPKTRTSVLPVGSNIPKIACSKAVARKILNIGEDQFVIGIFGTAHHSRLLPMAAAAARGAMQIEAKMLVCYAGPDGPAVEAAMPDIPFRDFGRLPARKVSQLFSAMDLYLAPFARGVSTRRGSFMVALQHGVPTVSTSGKQTDEVLMANDGKAFVLAHDTDMKGFVDKSNMLLHDPQRRATIGKAGRVLYDNTYSWATIASDMIKTLERWDRS